MLIVFLLRRLSLGSFLAGTCFSAAGTSSTLTGSATTTVIPQQQPAVPLPPEFDHGNGFNGAASSIGSAGTGSGNFRSATRLFNVLHRLGANPRQTEHTVLVHLQGHHQAADRIDSCFNQDVEDMFLQAKLFEGHAKRSRRDFGEGAGGLLLHGAGRVFLDLDRAAFHAVNELGEQRVFFRRDRAVLCLLRQHFLHSPEWSPSHWAGEQPGKHHYAVSGLHPRRLPPGT